MVRSASMFYCSEAVKYLPEFEDIISFSQHAGKGRPVADDEDVSKSGSAPEFVPNSGANLSTETCRAAENLDECIKTLVKNFGEGNDYFKVLVNVFQSVLLTDDHDHLKYFYMIGFYYLLQFF
jgi:WASH complex subunit 7